MEWLHWLLEGEPAFITRNCCGDFTFLLIATHVVGDTVTFFSYMVISTAVFVFWKKTKSVNARYFSLAIVSLFVFVFSCGITHLFDAMSFWIPC